MNNFYDDYMIVKETNIEAFETRMKQLLVAEGWETFGDLFHFNNYLCQQLVKYNDEL